MRDVTIPRSAMRAHDLLRTARSYDISDDVMLRCNLRRALAADGTGFRQMAAELIVAQAMDRLEGPGGAIEATARQLGYATPSGFVQAFRRWTGQTPGEFRRHRSTHR
ncbi:helix-turn-helix domain-containing protein [Microlunatus soli]|nr:helix-turn-helix domain-containing protein [Microlunatus soli]